MIFAADNAKNTEIRFIRCLLCNMFYDYFFFRQFKNFGNPFLCPQKAQNKFRALRWYGPKAAIHLNKKIYLL